MSRSLVVAMALLATACTSGESDPSGLRELALRKVVCAVSGIDFLDENDGSREVIADTIRFIAARLER